MDAVRNDSPPYPRTIPIDAFRDLLATFPPPQVLDVRRTPAFESDPVVIPGAVLVGGLDGWLRAYASDDGRLLWAFDTGQTFSTVNGVAARGGAIDGPGPTVAGGMVFVSSGYALFGQMPGNVLLAFGPKRR